MFLKHVDLTTALRPAYLLDEVLLFVQDNVGLYDGKYKIPNHQNGQVYLTSHRICYVDNEEPRKNSIAIDLKGVESYTFYGGFCIKSSPKITIFPKPSKRSSLPNRAMSGTNSTSNNSTVPALSRIDSPLRRSTPESRHKSAATWICPICSFSNPVPSNFDPHTAEEQYTTLAPCLTCGVQPPFALVFKAAIASAVDRPSQPSNAYLSNFEIDPYRNSLNSTPEILQPQGLRSSIGSPPSKGDAVFQCPKCTFENHPSLLSCEFCGAPSLSQDLPVGLGQAGLRTESPGPVLSHVPNLISDETECIKLSFRGGGEKVFYERLKSSMTQRKWILQGARPVPKPNRQGTPDGISSTSGSSTPTAERVKNVGIAGLEQRRLEARQNNELVIGNAFEDLEALMASAKEIIALAESFAKNGGMDGQETSDVANALGLVTTKDLLGSGSGSESLYLSELSRNLAEFLTDDARGILKKAGGIMTLVDIWAVFNRARGGVELVSPLDFEKAARLWETLKLPIRLRQFRSGVLVVQGNDRTDEKTIKTLLTWLESLHSSPPETASHLDWQSFGRGITARDAAEHFGWSLGVAEEELAMAEDRGALCLEESIEGLKFWENWIVDP